MNNKNIMALIMPLVLMTVLSCFGNSTGDTPPSKEEIIKALESIKAELTTQRKGLVNAATKDEKKKVLESNLASTAEYKTQLGKVKRIKKATEATRNTCDQEIEKYGRWEESIRRFLKKDSPEQHDINTTVNTIGGMKKEIDKLLEFLRS